MPAVNYGIGTPLLAFEGRKPGGCSSVRRLRWVMWQPGARLCRWCTACLQPMPDPPA